MYKRQALILAALMLFGCAGNSVQSSAGDTTPPWENSVTDSKNESAATENSSATDNTSKESEENLVKNIEGYQMCIRDRSHRVGGGYHAHARAAV